MGQEGISTFISAPDGLRLHARCYGSRISPNLPVLCLPGLARTAADFETLAGSLSADAQSPRRVVVLDYRGRGKSDYDRDPGNYSFQVELGDVLAAATALDAIPAIIVGTSRGGILAMLLAAKRPGAIAGAVLNDIGPVIEPKGLMRIKGYLGKLPQPRAFEEGAEILRRLFSAQFPKLSSEDWLAAAHRAFKEETGRLVPTYDPRLAKTLKSVNFDKPFPPLWKEFGALAHVPVMVVRGANSDILSSATVAAMRAAHPGLEAIEVPDQGHAPLLAEPDVIGRIASFARRCDHSHAANDLIASPK
jgi:pimeloyl-ACP methyl ester carboxylesterase